MIRSLLSGLSMLALATVAASAADLPRRALPYKAPAAYAPIFNWTGAYLGIHGGYSWGASRDIDLRGGFVGGQIGYNWQAVGNPWVFGVEVDSAWADMGTTETATSPAGVISATSRANYVGSARARVGYAWDRTLMYVTGGAGWVNNRISVNATVGGFNAGLSDTQTHVGGVVGAGIEHAFAPKLSAKLEYLYSGYNSRTYFSSAGGVPFNAGSHAIKVGLNYHFN